MSHIQSRTHTDPMHSRIMQLLSQDNPIIVGKELQIRLALACLFARGHLLIEDLPGMGKTTLAHMLAHLLGLQFNRIQFTSDLLPSDILGTTIYSKNEERFTFHPGPVFTQVVLADEINRASPKAQSALLEAMEERQISVEGNSYDLPEPFYVIATQNPSYHVGTFPLPESQYDRFLMRIHLGFPDRKAEREILRGKDRKILLRETAPCLSPDAVLQIQASVPGIQASDALLDYIQDIMAYTRNNPEFNHGLSPRASLALLRSAQSWAYLENRDLVLPEDVQAVLPAVIGHRLPNHTEQSYTALNQSIENLVRKIPVP